MIIPINDQKAIFSLNSICSFLFPWLSIVCSFRGFNLPIPHDEVLITTNRRNFILFSTSDGCISYNTVHTLVHNPLTKIKCVHRYIKIKNPNPIPAKKYTKLFNQKGYFSIITFFSNIIKFL